ncbi:outer membrane beta-barrel protein [Adhaeribacter sp. BT258]|uniref:Outer membrane beta-barrel protein n=1 Tax=Adhaeribacter terrigena TaxID=2793070 RepID=A0ABS1BWG6_9BACT|nr:outer membrane beta-barrel protein [Adhaeribacter terrigena]MBK0401464.1 outer membrane beta-barrel protein [Adhaeribacter terrigena]
MKKLIFAFFTILSFETYSQTPEIKPLGKFAIGITFSPDYCYRTLNADASSKPIADMRDEEEIAKLGFTTGATLFYTLGSRVALESGLLFSDKGEKTRERKYNFTEPIVNAPVAGTHNYHYFYIDVPTKVNYYLTIGKMKAFVSAGTSTNIFLKEKRSSTYTYADGRTEDRTVVSKPGFSRVNLVALAGFGVDYTLTENLQIRVEPIYRRSITSIINAPIKGYLYSAGINFGVYMKL